MKKFLPASAIDAACALVGGASKLAAAIGVAQSAISNWRKRGTLPDPAYCIAIERATGGQVTRADLRPHDCGQIWPEYQPPAAAGQGEAQPAQASGAGAPPAPAQNGRARRGAKRALPVKQKGNAC